MAHRTPADHDAPLSADELRCLDIIIPIVRSRDEAHRQQRWLTILEQVADMPEPQQTEAIAYMTHTLEQITGQQ